MRVSRSLDRVNLDCNPLGLDGAAAIVQALARRYVASVSLANCNFGTTGGLIEALSGDGARNVARFDIQRPNGGYKCASAQICLIGLYP